MSLKSHSTSNREVNSLASKTEQKCKLSRVRKGIRMHKATHISNVLLYLKRSRTLREREFLTIDSHDSTSSDFYSSMDTSNKMSHCNICLTFFHYEKGLQKLKGQPVGNTIYQNHGRQDHNPNSKIVCSSGLATSLRARVWLETEFGGHGREREFLPI